MKKLIAAMTILVVFSLVIVISGCNPKPKEGLKSPGTGTGTGTGTGPGPGTSSDPAGPAVYVPKGQTPEKYIDKHYEYVLKGDFEKAFDMLPSSTKAQQPKDQYISMQKGLNIVSYKVSKTEDVGDSKNITVLFKMAGAEGEWGTVWTFNKTEKGWEVYNKKSVQQQ